MTALRTFEEVLGSLAAEFGDVDAQFLTAKDRPERFVTAIRELAGDRGGLLLVRGAARSWIVGARSARRRVEGWLEDWKGSPIEEAVTTRTTEGALLALGVRPMPMELRDELRLVEGAAVEHLDLRAIRRLDALSDLDRDASWNGLSAIELAMLELKIVGQRGEEAVPTVAGMVAFGLRPHLFLPGMRVRYVDGEGERWIEGNAGDLRAAVLRDKVLVRGAGRAAMSELVMNAVAHRDWSAAAEEEPVVVERAGDVVEVRSPGRWEPRNGPPNPALANLLVARDLMTLTSTGRSEVRSWLKRQRARGVTWVGRGGVVRVVVEVAPERAKPVQAPVVAPAPVSGPLSPSVPPPVVRPPPPAPATRSSLPAVAEAGEADELDAVVYRSLEDRQRDVVDLLVEGGQQTRRQLQSALGWSRSTLRNVLESLIAEGKVMPSAEPVRSPFRTYSVRASMTASAAAARRG